MSLLADTQKLLDKRVAAGESLRQIARESSGIVEYEWLRKFANGDVKDPGVTRVESLHDFLAKPAKKSA
jgi:hypothetical protein